MKHSIWRWLKDKIYKLQCNKIEINLQLDTDNYFGIEILSKILRKIDFFIFQINIKWLIY